jgi:hypothetical protein
MGIGVSIFLIAVGAILKFAVNVHATGFSIATVGVILMIVGAIGLVMSVVIFGPWRTRSNGSATVTRNTYVDGAPYPPANTVTDERVYRDGL